MTLSQQLVGQKTFAKLLRASAFVTYTQVDFRIYTGRRGNKLLTLRAAAPGSVSETEPLPFSRPGPKKYAGDVRHKDHRELQHVRRGRPLAPGEVIQYLSHPEAVIYTEGVF